MVNNKEIDFFEIVVPSMIDCLVNSFVDCTCIIFNVLLTDNNSADICRDWDERSQGQRVPSWTIFSILGEVLHDDFDWRIHMSVLTIV